jgi:hypothetical protein
MRSLLCSLVLCIMVCLGICVPAQAYEPKLHLADWQVARMSPASFVERYTEGRSSSPGAGGLYREAMEQYNACLHRYTVHRAHRLPTVLRRQFQNVSALADSWHSAYYRCGWDLCPGTFWCDSSGGDTMRMEQMLVSVERALHSHKSIRRLRKPAWEQEFDRILVDLKKRKASEVNYPEKARDFLIERQEFLHQSVRLRRAWRRLPPVVDRSILYYLTCIHENMNDQSFPFPG